MEGKDKEVSDLYKDYKDLPLKMRVRVNMTAKKILEIQKENKAFIYNAIDASLYEDGELNPKQLKMVFIENKSGLV